MGNNITHSYEEIREIGTKGSELKDPASSDLYIICIQFAYNLHIIHNKVLVHPDVAINGK